MSQPKATVAQSRTNEKSERRIGQRRSGVIVARETREHPRVNTELEVRICTLDPLVGDQDQTPYFVVASAVTRDVADGGLRLEADADLDEGRRVLVEMELSGGVTVERKGQVVWASHDEAGTSEVGIKFDEACLGLASHAGKND